MRRIAVQEIREAIANGEVIEDYPYRYFRARLLHLPDHPHLATLLHAAASG